MSTTKWLKMIDVAEMLGVSYTTVRTMVRNGDLPAYRYAKAAYRIKQVDVELYIHEQLMPKPVPEPTKPKRRRRRAKPRDRHGVAPQQ